MYSIYKKVQDIFLKVFLLIVYLSSIVIPVSMFCQVIARYFLKKPIAGVEEIATASFVWMVIFGSAILFKEKKHIIVDAFINKRSKKTKKIIDILSNLLMLIIFIILIYSCAIAIPYQKFYKTVILKIPAVYHIKAFIISLIFMTICCIENILVNLLGDKKNA